MEQLKGFYRFYIKHKGQEFCYVGTSKDVGGRLNYHKKSIYSFYQGKNLEKFLKFLKIKKIVNKKDATYLKTTFFLYHYKFRPGDFCSEKLIPSRIYQNENEIDAQEIKYIEEFNSELQGFNSIRGFKMQFSKELEKAIPEDRRVWIETMLRKEEKKIVQVKARLLKLFTNNEKWHKEFMPWNLFLLRPKKKEDEENYQKMKCKWENLCEQLLQKIKKTKN